MAGQVPEYMVPEHVGPEHIGPVSLFREV